MNHLEPELIAAFAEGQLRDAELTYVSDHLRDCTECRESVGETVRFLRELQPAVVVPRRRPVWLAAAAAILILAGAGTFAWRLRSRSPMRELVAAAPADVRFIEPRLSGFPAAPLAVVVRGNEQDPRQMELTGVAGRVLRQTSGDSSPDAIHAAAVAQLLTAETAQAIAKLKTVAEKSNDATIWNDLAAAQYEARVEDPAQLAIALASVDRALASDPSMHEALFNRALILTQLARKPDAVAAWSRFLEAESTGTFADEARRHLQSLRHTSS